MTTNSPMKHKKNPGAIPCHNATKASVTKWEMSLFPRKRSLLYKYLEIRTVFRSFDLLLICSFQFVSLSEMSLVLNSPSPHNSIQFNSILFTHIRNTIYFSGKKINIQSIIFKWFYLLGKKCAVAKGARLSCWPLPLCSYKNGGR